MATFTKLSEVERINKASDNANVLVEDNGKIKRVPKNEVLGEMSLVASDSLSDTANLLIEDGGELKKIPVSEIRKSSGAVVRLINTGTWESDLSFDEIRNKILSGDHVLFVMESSGEFTVWCVDMVCEERIRVAYEYEKCDMYPNGDFLSND